MSHALPAKPRELALCLQGTVRVDRRTKNLVSRLRPGDIAVIDHPDLDGLAARSLAEAKVAAVINAAPFVTGRYPNKGPGILLQARIPLYQLADHAAFARIKEGEPAQIDSGGWLRFGDRQYLEITRWDAARIARATEQAQENLQGELAQFARNTLLHLEADKELLLDLPNVPPLRGFKLSGRQALIAVRGEGYREDLRSLRPYLQQVRPVIIAVDGAADALLRMGFTPHIILGDMDSVSTEALRCGAQLIVHAYKDGRAPGLHRLESLGLKGDIFAVPGTSEDAAMLLAYEHGADLIAAVGTHSHLEDFLDKGRAGMASTFLVRLKVGPRLVDARGVNRLYQPRPPFAAFVALLLSALFPLAMLLKNIPLWQNLAQLLIIWWRLHFHS